MFKRLNNRRRARLMRRRNAWADSQIDLDRIYS